jgi:hypothetical protein
MTDIHLWYPFAPVTSRSFASPHFDNPLKPTLKNDSLPSPGLFTCKKIGRFFNSEQAGQTAAETCMMACAGETA